MSGSPYRSAPHRPWASLRWEHPWAWPLAQQVGVLAALVCVLSVACWASLWPWWEALDALQQSHQRLAAQFETSQQKLRELPELEQRVQALRDAHERRNRDSAGEQVGWLHPVIWTPVPAPAGASAAPRWRGQTQGQASEVALVLAQLAAADHALPMELFRTAPAGQWRLTWEVLGDAPPVGSSPRPHLSRDWRALLDDAPMRAHWQALLKAQPGRVQWVWPQLHRSAEPLETFELAQLTWIGWLEQGDRRVALVQAGANVHRVAIGGYMGRHHGRVEHIGADHLVLREVLRNPQGVWAPSLTRWPALGSMVSQGSVSPPKAKDLP